MSDTNVIRSNERRVAHGGLRRTDSLVEQAAKTAHRENEARRSEGKAMRSTVPRGSHSQYEASPERPDPVALLLGQDGVRIQSLLPIRFGRMAASPFSFYRGAAIVMAHDLATTPTTGWLSQACGDAHLENFGGFGTEQGSLVFDVNDFDETYPAPWEWDLKRLATSAVLAVRESGAKASDQRAAAGRAASGYRRAVRRLADMGVMARWSAIVDLPKALALMGSSTAQIDKVTTAALKKTNVGAFPKLTELVNGRREIRENPPLVVRLTDEAELHTVKEGFASYRETLRPELRLLLDRFSLVDFARKVVGVGSVGMPAYVGLYMSADNDPLFLQFKLAVDPVVKPFVTIDGQPRHAGERVVVGQRLMQVAGDPLLGWTTGADDQHFYVRQLRDMKLSFDVTTMKPSQVVSYVGLCAEVLARAHSRTGDPALIAGYLGSSKKSGAFEAAITDFAVAYADQTERDQGVLAQAIKDGRVEAQSGI
jgi:uncharacterized protein (DUF2252 family)